MIYYGAGYMSMCYYYYYYYYYYILFILISSPSFEPSIASMLCYLLVVCATTNICNISLDFTSA